MKLLFTIAITLYLCACTTLVPVKSSPDLLHQQIITDEIAKIGDDVLIITQDGKRYEFEIVTKTETTLLGKKSSILITDIVALETREISKGKTFWLAAGTVLTIQILRAIASIMVIGG